MDTTKPSRPAVLCVEDDPEYQELLSAILAGICDLTICTNVEESREMIQPGRFALIISDINLIGLTGFSTLDFVKQAGLAETCPVILCSGQSDPETRRRAMDAGAAGFMRKPFDSDAMVRLVADMLKCQPDLGGNRPGPAPGT